MTRNYSVIFYFFNRDLRSNKIEYLPGDAFSNLPRIQNLYVCKPRVVKKYYPKYGSPPYLAGGGGMGELVAHSRPRNQDLPSLVQALVRASPVVLIKVGYHVASTASNVVELCQNCPKFTNYATRFQHYAHK